MERFANKEHSTVLAQFTSRISWCGRGVDPFVKVKGWVMDFINLDSGHGRHNSNVSVPLFEPSHNDSLCCVFAAGGGANCGIRVVGSCVVPREEGGSSCSGCGLT